MNHTRFTNDDHLREALGDFAHDEASPDFSRAIMGRLGYMRVSPIVARRRRMMRWTHRAATLAVVGVAVAMGWRVFESSDQVRRPVETTLPQAVSHDLQQQSERIGSMIQTIRQISSPKFAPRSEQTYPPRAPAADSQLASPDHRGIQPQQTAPGSMDQPYSTDRRDGSPSDGIEPHVEAPAPHRPNDQWDEHWDPTEMRELSDRVNRDQLSPVRWA